MKITAVTPLTSSFMFERDPMSYCFVRVETDTGLVGYGEACDSYGCSYGSVLATVVDDVLAPLLVGQPVTAVEPLADRMRLFTRRRLGDQWVAVHARSALELALWDVTGKAAGRSASSLTGSVRDRVEVYVSSVFLEEQPAEAHVQFLLPFLQRGVTKVKLRIGPEWQPDLSTLAEIRALLGPGVELMVDGSEIFTLPTAQTVATALHALDVRWFEEPLPQGNRSGIESLVRSSPVPIAYGEHLFGADEAIEAMRREQLHVLQPDASTCGGLAEARRMAQAAVPFGVRVVPHVCAGPVSLAANLHLAASVPAIRLIEYPPTLAPSWSTFGGRTAFDFESIVDGCLAVPTAPGLGVELDEHAVAQHPYRPPGARVAGTVGGLPDRFVGDR
jgi:D-galactarolactone cycloisomerase